MSSLSHDRTHYETLEIAASASSEEIKQAYRRLVKQHHPDTSRQEGMRIRQINAAYAVLRHRESRHEYDQNLQPARRVQSTPKAPQSTVSDEATAQQAWIRQVYNPLNRMLATLLASLRPQLKALAADPFDQELVDGFESYLQDSRQKIEKAQTQFRQVPNPGSLAGVASRLYYILNHLEDAVDELKYFPLNFDDRHLHTGEELFRRARELRQEAVEAFKLVRLVG